MTTDPTRAQADEALMRMAERLREHAEKHVDCATGQDQLLAIANELTALRQRLAADAQPLEAKRYYDGNGNRRGPRLSELRECSPPAQSEGSRG